MSDFDSETSLYNTGIRADFDKWLIEKDKERDYGEYWSASSAGFCMRLNIMRRLKIPRIPEIENDRARTLRVFEAGHTFHEMMQKVTKANGSSIASEVELQDEKLMVRGHFDDLVKKNDRLILYDYKTAHSKSFNFKRDEMGHYHKMQLGTYIYMLKDKYPDLKEARILTIEKDTVRMKEEQMFYSQALEKEVVEYWTTLNGYWNKKMLPRCTCLDIDGGFMGKRTKAGKIYNDYMYNDIPCNIEWALKHKELMKGWKYS